MQDLTPQFALRIRLTWVAYLITSIQMIIQFK
jgi:hypothetical protein